MLITTSPISLHFHRLPQLFSLRYLAKFWQISALAWGVKWIKMGWKLRARAAPKMGNGKTHQHCPIQPPQFVLSRFLLEQNIHHVYTYSWKGSDLWLLNFNISSNSKLETPQSLKAHYNEKLDAKILRSYITHVIFEKLFVDGFNQILHSALTMNSKMFWKTIFRSVYLNFQVQATTLRQRFIKSDNTHTS